MSNKADFQVLKSDKRTMKWERKADNASQTGYSARQQGVIHQGAKRYPSKGKAESKGADERKGS